MSDVKTIWIAGEIEVEGIYNYNGTEYRNGNKNHKGAKRDRTGRDFTSSRCLRHDIFKDIQPRQPSQKEMAEHFVALASSEIGLLRGYLAPHDELKRYSPLHVADAYTTDEYMTTTNKEGEEDSRVLIYDQGTSSKPKEGELKDKTGEDMSDTSIFSQDNAPKRRQAFKAAINLKELQFLPLEDGYYRMVSAEMESDFLKGLEQEFKKLGHNYVPQIKEYQDALSILPIKRRGILLADAEMKILATSVVNRILALGNSKAGASLYIVPETLTISFGDNLKKRTCKVEEFEQVLEQVTFASFYKEYAQAPVKG